MVSDKVSTRGARVVEHLFIAILFHDIWGAGGLDPAIAAHFPDTLHSGVGSVLCERYCFSPSVRKEEGRKAEALT